MTNGFQNHLLNIYLSSSIYLSKFILKIFNFLKWIDFGQKMDKNIDKNGQVEWTKMDKLVLY